MVVVSAAIPKGAAHPDLFEEFPTICRWVLGRTVSTAALAAELRRAADEEQAALDKFAALAEGDR